MPNLDPLGGPEITAGEYRYQICVLLARVAEELKEIRKTLQSISKDF
jgi:hypothetical protein